jgi:hypothetical protein
MKNVEKELRQLDELYDPPRVNSFEDSVLHKTKATLDKEKLKEQLVKDKKMTSFGRICFELGDLDYWTKKLSLERSYEPFYERSTGQFEFVESFLKLKSKKLRITDHADTGLPIKNFVITLEFKTKDKDAPLFSMNSPIDEAGHDRHIFLRNGKAVVRVSLAHQFTCKKQELADN